MKNSVSTIPLTHFGNDVRYRKLPTNHEFECILNPGVTRQLITEPAVLLKIPTDPKDFWLRVLLDSLWTRSQFVFTTFLPRQHGDTSNRPVARTLFQLDGDVLLKIDKGLLTRADGISILKAHFGWTEWCLTELGRALSLPHFLRNISGFVCLSGLALSLGPAFADVSGSIWATLQVLGLLLLMTLHLLFPAPILRYLRWVPTLIGACSTGFGTVNFSNPVFAVFLVVVGALSGFSGGLVLWPIAWKVILYKLGKP